MTDDQFRELRTLILDQKVEIKALAMTVRSLERRLNELAADPDLVNEMSEKPASVYITDELNDLIKTRSRP
ncbi:hypothetical protein [Pararhizobium sp.]|uniref:hypothetical protein n=1 Tax=Pararhizobium sp. TaxID=1977563 RepID=UPI00271D59FA|nr:hypothetical protein [Pararhizobium sp.]MDO9417024.1 hypothetical protein [Pararhizobium sp.]